MNCNTEGQEPAPELVMNAHLLEKTINRQLMLR